MVASLPVPPDLLIPVNTRNFSDPSLPCEIFVTPLLSLFFYLCFFFCILDSGMFWVQFQRVLLFLSFFFSFPFAVFFLTHWVFPLCKFFLGGKWAVVPCIPLGIKTETQSLEDAKEPTARNGDALEMWRPIRNTVSATCTEAVPVQESMWKFIHLLILIITRRLALIRPPLFRRTPPVNPTTVFLHYFPELSVRRRTLSLSVVVPVQVQLLKISHLLLTKNQTGS